MVTRVVDGDTLWLKTSASQQTLKVPIQGIDAPEICLPGGVQAREALKQRVLGQSVTVTSGAHDDYGRTVGTVHLQGQDLGRWLVAEGHAWVYSIRGKKALTLTSCIKPSWYGVVFSVMLLPKSPGCFASVMVVATRADKTSLSYMKSSHI